ncbi:MAG: protoheme IX farnesyltransferase [Gemmatimonadetes bacterium]|nr:protoheme IX farnesyltransferase [Gemmatimonadota bacterium]
MTEAVEARTDPPPDPGPDSTPDETPARGKAGALYELTKPGITGYVMMTAGVSYYVASGGRVEVLPLIHTLLGVALGTAGALALNQYVEREVDAVMTRTSKRPLPSGRLRPAEALAFGGALLVVGVVYLGLMVGWLPSVLTAASAAAYILAYTPLKTRSYLATLVGAVPGAFPALIGWSAATGTVEFGAVILFCIAFLWQLPHVLALAWLLREDYARVGFFLSPPSDPEGLQIGRHMVYHSVSLLAISGLPTFLGLTGQIYLVGAFVLGLITLGFSVAAAAQMSRPRARRVFLWSLLYQPLLLGLLLIDTVG